jgi:hypothetical protein
VNRFDIRKRARDHFVRVSHFSVCRNCNFNDDTDNITFIDRRDAVVVIDLDNITYPYQLIISQKIAFVSFIQHKLNAEYIINSNVSAIIV